ncbi:MAG TPA: TonB-dependent siderophore receptor [Ensifer sp.]|nr:TonB-dependent siderophore receptor [Ensifer sp.]
MMKSMKSVLPTAGAVMVRVMLGTTCLSAIAMGETQRAFAQDTQARAFDIPATSLGSALRIFAGQSGLQIAYRTSIAANLRGVAVKGTMPPETALARLLAGTGLTYTTSSGAVTIMAAGSPSAANAAPVANATNLGAIVVNGAANSSTAPIDGYVASVASAGSKTDTPILETPQSVSVVTRDQMSNQRVASLAETMSYTPGITAQSGSFSRLVDDFMIRGFNAANGNTGSLRDGMKLQSNVYDGGQEPYGLERVEVLRGASSTLYGQLAPGGVVNAVSKRPVDTPLHEVNIEVGSYGRKQVSTDFGGPIDKDGVATYRLTGLVRQSSNWMYYTPDDKVYLAPAVTLKPDEATSLTLLGSYQHVNTLFSPPYLLADIKSGALSRSTFTGIQGFDRYVTDTYTIGAMFEHDFDGGPKLRSNLRYFESTLDWNYMMSNLASLSSTGGRMARLASLRQEKSYGVTSDTSLEFNFDALGAEHTLLTGFDYYRRFYDSHRYRGTASSVLNLATGAYTGSAAVNYNIDRGSRTLGNQYGIYLQDQIKIDDHWVLLLGGRQDWADSVTTNYQTKTVTTQSDAAATGRAGLVYLFDNGIAPYLTVSQSFLPQAGTDSRTGNALKPNTGLQYEAGIRYQPPGTNLIFSGSVYDLTQTNVVTYDSNGLAYQQGKVRSRGVELEARGEINNWGLVASYAYTDARITESALASEVGQQVALVPYHSASLWADYGLDDIGLEGVRIGGGVRYVGETNLTDVKEKVPGYLLVDAMAKFDLGKMKRELEGLDLTLNARNLFNKGYYTCTASDGCRFGEPLTVSAKLSIKW